MNISDERPDERSSDETTQSTGSHGVDNRPEDASPDGGTPGQRGQDGDPEEPAKKSDFAADLFEWANAMMSAIVMIMLVFAFVASIFSVNQKSMTDTLQPGDVLLISNLFYTPAQDDVVMFTKADVTNANDAYDAANDRHSPFVKRIIAVAGDTLYYDGSANKLVRNGVPLEEPYIREQDFGPKGYLLDSEYTVPEGFVFVCGDNRNGSLDSRSFGPVDTRMILGRVLFRLFPLNQLGTV